MLNDLLFELGTEELPSASVWPLADGLARNLAVGFAKAGILHGEVHVYATPRRLAVLIEAVSPKQPNQAISRRGPSCEGSLDANGKPMPSLLGFAKSCGVSVHELKKNKTDKGEWWIYKAEREGAETETLLPVMIQDAISALPIPKPMRWGSSEDLFVRPVHWAILLFGEKIVSARVLGVDTGRHSYGHRFHHPAAIEIPMPRAYESLLKEACVIADFSKRRHQILDLVQRMAAEHNYEAVIPEALLDEVTSIVEWPQALLANFEQSFLEVPPEALIAAMQSHQKCFALRNTEGHLMPHFITIANIQSSEPQQVTLGNEKVMRARLSDAAFFYRQDKRKTLEQYCSETDRVVFQEKLGTLQEKTVRMQMLIEHLIKPMHLERAEAVRASYLSKSDLMTGMVGEFPELQGLMGYYYALNDGESPSVAEALYEQYLPRFAADTLPKTSLGCALSLVDRLDTLVGAFAIGQKPTGDKDPFKLRRHALAIVRLLISRPEVLNLSSLIKAAIEGYRPKLPLVSPTLSTELKYFILERMQSFYQTQGVSPELVLAVRAIQDDELCDLNQRVNALLEFAPLPDAISLSAACKRVNNLLQNIDVSKSTQAIDTALLTEAAENSLFEQILAVEGAVVPFYSSRDYGKILKLLASLRKPVDIFFERVMVMVDDQTVKENRLRLLARLQTLLRGVADISLLPNI